jgi:DNA-binding NarL/FixJ family response regulator/signal transduction histidine kinase
MARLLRPLVERRTYLETLDLVLDLAFGILWFTLFTTAIALGVSLLITLVGLPILTATFLLARGGARLERLRARTFLGIDIPAPLERPSGDGVWAKLVAPFRSRTTWKQLFYLWLGQPILSLVNFTVAVTAWAVPLWALTLPLYAVRSPGAAPEIWPGERLDTWHEVLPVAAAGLLLLPLVPWVIRGVASADAWLARVGLEPSRTEALEDRIDVLRETQARSVDIALADRRQIERDLHDGAQQRLLSLGMNLGMALEKFETEPEEARVLVSDAHRELQRAIGELRSLARGIHPGGPHGPRARRGAFCARLALAAPRPARRRAARASAGVGRGDGVLHRRRGADERGATRGRDGRRRACAARRQRRRAATAGRGRRRRRRRRRTASRGRPRRPRRSRLVARGVAAGREPRRRSDGPRRGASVRIVIAEDSVLLRDGLVRMLSDHGHEVVGEVEDAGGLVQLVERESPDLAVLDVRMPPTHTDEGIRAALELRSRRPELAILVLSQYVEENYATELLSGDLRGIGYLLKDRVTNVGGFVETVDRLAAGGTAIDPEVVSQLLARTRRQQPLADLSPREREVLALMAGGGRTWRSRSSWS